MTRIELQDLAPPAGRGVPLLQSVVAEPHAVQRHLAGAAVAQQENRPEQEFFTVRAGYEVSVAATLPDARFLEFDDTGTLYVSRPDRGDIVAFRDEDIEFLETPDDLVDRGVAVPIGFAGSINPT